jgi:hypothetical protein
MMCIFDEKAFFSIIIWTRFNDISFIIIEICSASDILY